MAGPLGLDTDPHELGEVSRAQPGCEATGIGGALGDVADADRQHVEAIFVGIQASERLAEHLADAVAGVGPEIGVGRDRLVEPVDRKSVVEGKSVSVRVDLGGRRIIKKKKQKIVTLSPVTTYSYI